MPSRYLPPKKKVRFKVSLFVVIFSVITLLTASDGIIIWLEGEQAAKVSSQALVREISHRVAGNWHSMLQDVAATVQTTAAAPSLITPVVAPAASNPSLPILQDCLNAKEEIISAYVGHADGSFLQAIKPRDEPGILEQYQAPAGTDLIVRSIVPNGGEVLEHWEFLDTNGDVLASNEVPWSGYDPRARPWYQAAADARRPYFTDPYVYAFTKAPGITCALPLPKAGAILGVDMTLHGFDTFLDSQYISPNGEIYVLDASLHLVSHSGAHSLAVARNHNATTLELVSAADAGDPLLAAAAAMLRTSNATAAPSPDGAHRGVQSLQVDGREYVLAIYSTQHRGWNPKHIVVAAPMVDFVGHLKRMQQHGALVGLAVFALAIPLAVFIARRVAVPLETMEKEARQIHQFNFAERPPLESFIKEVDALSQAFHLMKATIRSRTEALLDTQGKLEQLVERGIALASEHNMDKLLEMIFLTAKDLTNADAGVLAMLDENGMLQPISMRFDSMDLGHDCSRGEACPLPPVPVDSPDSCQIGGRHFIACRAVQEQRTVSIGGHDGGQVERDAEMIFEMPEFGEGTAYLIRTQMASPLITRSGKVIGVLHLMNARDELTWNTVPFGHRDGFVEALAAQAAVAIHNQSLLKEIEGLFDAFVKLIADAIDAKSPYTGGHCARVPVIAKMLGQAAHDDVEGPLADFQFANAEAWREFHIAAWLHDCGKVTTPEYVVDKATKLETVRNRIHEVRMRFEVLLRDAEIDALNKQAQPGADQDAITQELEALKQTLTEEFEFVAQSNIGGEFLSDEAIATLRQIGTRTWERRLDDRLGISEDERHRLESHPHQPPPVMEPLLADKPEHIIHRNGRPAYLDNGLGIKIQVPEHQYDLGELHNLSVRRGTLTTEDRFKIQEHVIQTIVMLENLPFPENLAQVPEIAGAHHETLDGKGYPRRLKAPDMSIPARILAIADIFEALTAADRPYKEGKTLSEALGIMAKMRDGGHIDPDLFALFLKVGLHMEYGKEYLRGDQMDDVDVEGLMHPQPAT